MIQAEAPGPAARLRDEPGFLSGQRRRVDAALEALTSEHGRGIPEHLREPVEYALSTTGKRLRPILCVQAYIASELHTKVPPALYRLACALEIVHTYSLVHDDLPCMDDDDLRRGRPTVHRVFGPVRATLAGAALLPIAMQVVSSEGEALGLSLEERARMITELARSAGAAGMVGGQLMDLAGEQRAVKAMELEAIHRRKTGALLTCSLRIGAIAGRASGDLLHAITAYGAALGLAFQIADDLLDVEGDSAELGKTAGRDIALRKASYPALFGVQGARELARQKVEEAKSALGARELPELRALADYVIERGK
ncbi:MAG: polyprenyl synthetase family protein [Gemmatimonadota bacterium]